MCSGSSKLWEFEIPKPIDPQNTAVSIAVGISKLFFSYDSQTTTITQNAFEVSPGIQKISF